MTNERHALALITIGQSPRHDYDADLPALLPPRTTLVQHGALDALPSLAAAHALLGPGQDTQQVLVSRMRDGAQVTMDAAKLEPLLEECVRRVAAGEGPANGGNGGGRQGPGAPDAILLLCTGDVPAFADLPVPVVAPQSAVRSFLEEQQQQGTPPRRLVVVSPEARQVGPASARWEGVGGCTVVGGFAATPYGERSAEELEGCVESVRGLGLREGGEGEALVYMDCMGYTLAQKRFVEERMGMEVVVPREVVFRAVGRFFGEL